MSLKVYVSFLFFQLVGASAWVSVLVIFFILFLERGAHYKIIGAKKKLGSDSEIFHKIDLKIFHKGILSILNHI